MPLDTEVCLGPYDIVIRWGPSSPVPKMGQSSQFIAHVYCGQTGGCIKMPLGMEVPLDRGHIVLDGHPAPPPQKEAQRSPIFGPCLLRPNGWVHQDTTCYGGRPQPR